MSLTAALESRTSKNQQAPDPVSESVPDPPPVPDAGLSPPSEATCTTQQRSDAASGKVPGGASTAAARVSVGASVGAPSAVPAGASSRASVTAASRAPDGSRPKEPPRVPCEVPAGRSEAPGATNSHSGPSSGTEKASSRHHPTVAPAPEAGTSGCFRPDVQDTSCLS